MAGRCLLLIAVVMMAVPVVASVSSEFEKVTVGFEEEEYTVTEGDGTFKEVAVNVEKTVGDLDDAVLSETLHVTITSSSDTAKDGVDFHTVDKSFPVTSEGSTPVHVTIVDNAVVTGSRRFYLDLNVVNDTENVEVTMGITRCTVTIEEDDKVCVQFSQTSYSAHVNESLSLWVEISGTLGLPKDANIRVNVSLPELVSVSLPELVSVSLPGENRTLTFSSKDQSAQEARFPPTHTSTLLTFNATLTNFTADIPVGLCRSKVARVDVTLSPQQQRKLLTDVLTELKELKEQVKPLNSANLPPSESLSTPLAEDECANAVDCGSNATCVNESCQCKPGFTGDGATCTDVNECLKDADNNCDENAECSNTIGSFECTCNPGYSGDGTTCEADDCKAECDYTNGGCDDGGHCACNGGFTSPDGTTCEEDECEAKCDYTITVCGDDGSCVCKDGFTLKDEGTTCEVDECGAVCDYTHGRCDDDGRCACNDGFTLKDDGKTCEDIDECQEDNDCDENADCSNTEGSFECVCKPGYSGSGTTCTADDCEAECDYTNGRCGDDRYCGCNDGYTLPDEGKTCKEDECGAVCDYTNGGCGVDGHCACNDGYTLPDEGITCTEDNESGTSYTTWVVVTVIAIIVVAVAGYVGYQNREKIMSYVKGLTGGGGGGSSARPRRRYRRLPQSVHDTVTHED